MVEDVALYDAKGQPLLKKAEVSNQPNADTSNEKKAPKGNRFPRDKYKPVKVRDNTTGKEYDSLYAVAKDLAPEELKKNHFYYHVLTKRFPGRFQEIRP